MHYNIFPCNLLRKHTTYICQSCMSQCERVHCIKDPFFYKERKQGKNCEEKVGKSKAKKVWEKKTLILQPPVPSFLWGWGLPGLIQHQLYNVFLPFNRLHQHTRVYYLQLQTVAVSNKSVFNCGCCERPWFSQTHGRTQKNNTDNTGHCKELLKDALSPCIYYICIGKLSTVKRWIH